MSTLNDSLISSRNTISISEKHNLKFFKKPDIQVTRPSKTFIFLDQALLYVGDNSVYSKRILGFFCFYWIWYTFLFMGMPLLLEGDRVIFCPTGEPDSFQMCDETEACNNFALEDLLIQPANSIVAEFKLVCDRKKLVPLINAVIFLSIFVSGPVFSILSNKLGRKNTILLSCTLSSVSLLLAGLFQEFYIWLFFIFLAGGGFSGLEVVGRVYLSEISGSNFRINSMAFLNLVWAGSQIFLVLVKAVINYWRYIFIYFMGWLFLIVMLIGHFFFMEESPKFLLHKNRIEVNSIGVYSRA